MRKKAGFKLAQKMVAVTLAACCMISTGNLSALAARSRSSPSRMLGDELDKNVVEDTLETRYGKQVDSVEAETGQVFGGARIASDEDSTAWSGGGKVGNVGKEGGVEIPVKVDNEKKYRVEVHYMTAANRDLVVTVNDGKPVKLEGLNSGSYNVPSEVSFEAELKSGDNTLSIGNPDAAAPDVDCVNVYEEGEAQHDYLFEGNMVQNPGFEQGTDAWRFYQGGSASNNNHTGEHGYYLDAGDAIVMQEVPVPFTGYYEIATWVSTGGPGGTFGYTRKGSSEKQEISLPANSNYTRYKFDAFLNKGDVVRTYVKGGNSWVNGDDFSVTYNTSKFQNLLVNGKFQYHYSWICTNADIANGKATLTDSSSSVEQKVFIPMTGPYYAEVVLSGAQDSVVSFGGQTKTVDTNAETTIRLEADDLAAGDETSLKVEGKALVKQAIVKFDLSKISNTPPSAEKVTVKGEPVVGKTVTADYQFTDPDEGQSEGTSLYRWLIADKVDVPYAPIKGQTEKVLTIAPDMKDRFLKFEVTPVDQYEGKGEPVLSEPFGPVDLNLVSDADFEQDGKGWSGMGISHRNVYKGLVCAKVGKSGEMTQTITVPQTGCYDLNAFIWDKDGTKGDGVFGLREVTGKVIKEGSIPAPTSDYEQQKIEKVPLEKGQKAVLYFKASSDADIYVDDMSLIFNRDAEIPVYNNIIDFALENQFADTVINREEKNVKVTFAYGVDVSNVKVTRMELSEGAAANVQVGQRLNLTKPAAIMVKDSTGASHAWTITVEIKSKRGTLTSSNQDLQDSFNWAANKVDQFVMTGKQGYINKDENRPTGTGTDKYIPSYWAGYYDRTAFYGRDFVHQATGGQIVGLYKENYSMFHTFAKNATEARKWFTPWAFNFNGTPHTIDYRDDTNFVREVPAQFELVQKAYEQYLWSGDERYINDPDMFNFYTKVMTDFITLHDTNHNGVAEGTGGGIFQGACSYNERGGEPMIEAGDSIGSQYQATLAYAGILEARGDKTGAASWYQKAADLKKYFNETWSVYDNDPNGLYARGLDKDNTKKYTGFGGENSWFMPMKLITEPGERNDKYIDYVLENLGDGIDSVSTAPHNIEAYTYIPDMLFPYNRANDAWKWMKYITGMKDKPHERASQGTNGDYPEISFTFISHVVEGMMGVSPDAKNGFVSSIPRLPDEVKDAAIKYLQIGDYEISLAHNGNRKSTLSNDSAKDMVWEARFYGSHPYVQVNGKPVAAQTKLLNGKTISYVTLPVKSGQKVVAEATDTLYPIDKTKLQNAIRAAKDVDKANYTAASVQTMEAALSEAEAILENADATEQQVKDAAEKLNKAVSQLVPVETHHNHKTTPTPAPAPVNPGNEVKVDTNKKSATVITVPDATPVSSNGTTTVTTTVDSGMNTGSVNTINIVLPNTEIKTAVKTENVVMQVRLPAAIAENSDSSQKIIINATADVLQAAAQSGKKVSIHVINADTGKVSYTCTIDGSTLNKAAITKDINIVMSIKALDSNANINKAAQGKSGFVLNFSHSGSLPGPTTFTIPAGNYPAGTSLYLYYYNKLGLLEPVNQTCTVDTNGDVAVTISHCSQYVLLNQKTANTLTLDTVNPYTFGVGDQYTFLVKSTSKTIPTATMADHSIASVKYLKKAVNGYLFQITGLKDGATSVCVTQDGKIGAFQINVKGATIKCDTTDTFRVKSGKSYVFKFTVQNGAKKTPMFFVGNSGAFRTEILKKNGNDYYFKITATGKPGSGTGVYSQLPGQAAVRQCVVNIG